MNGLYELGNSERTVMDVLLRFRVSYSFLIVIEVLLLHHERAKFSAFLISVFSFQKSF